MKGILTDLLVTMSKVHQTLMVVVVVLIPVGAFRGNGVEDIIGNRG